MYVFVHVHKNGGEGIVALQIPGMAMPMVCSTTRGLETLRLAAQKAAAESNKSIQLLRFTGRTVLETFEPPSN
jgi:hypothetical protein